MQSICVLIGKVGIIISVAIIQIKVVTSSNIASSARLDCPIADKRHFGVHRWRADGRGFVLPCSSDRGLHGDGKLSFIRVS